MSADLLAFQLKALGIPFQREYRFHAERRWRFDFAIHPETMKLAVEVQGGVFTAGRHARGAGITKDCEKFSIAAGMGWRLMPVTPAQVKSGEALEWIGKALA